MGTLPKLMIFIMKIVQAFSLIIFIVCLNLSKIGPQNVAAEENTHVANMGPQNVAAEENTHVENMDYYGPKPHHYGSKPYKCKRRCKCKRRYVPYTEAWLRCHERRSG